MPITPPELPPGTVTVTELKPAKGASGDAGRIKVALDGEAWGTVADVIVSEFRLFTGRVLAREEVAELQERVVGYDALRYCHQAISRRALTERELATKLLEKGFAAEVVQEVIERSRHLGLVDDARYALSFAQGRRSRGVGPQRIRQDLARRGVERGLVEAALADVATDDDGEGAFERTCVDTARSRFGRADLEDERERGRALRFLVRRGYSFDDAAGAVKELRREQATAAD